MVFVAWEHAAEGKADGSAQQAYFRSSTEIVRLKPDEIVALVLPVVNVVVAVVMAERGLLLFAGDVGLSWRHCLYCCFCLSHFGAIVVR